MTAIIEYGYANAKVLEDVSSIDYKGERGTATVIFNNEAEDLSLDRVSRIYLYEERRGQNEGNGCV